MASFVLYIINQELGGDRPNGDDVDPNDGSDADNIDDDHVHRGRSQGRDG